MWNMKCFLTRVNAGASEVVTEGQKLYGYNSLQKKISTARI